MWNIRVITHYVSWQTPAGIISNEMYPTLTYACASTSYAGEVPGELGKIYVDVECNSLVRDAMRLDPLLQIVSEVPPNTLEEGEAV